MRGYDVVDYRRLDCGGGDNPFDYQHEFESDKQIGGKTK